MREVCIFLFLLEIIKISLLKLTNYRHVLLPREIAKKLPEPQRILSEDEWRGLGVQQSRGWVHYEVHVAKINNLINL